jgi:hypothetical protein
MMNVREGDRAGGHASRPRVVIHISTPMHLSATYSPDDNKLRLYASSRLDADTYARVKAAGFKWAPRQKLFVAPMWTPEREDVLLALCGEIGDEDTSLVERAEERAERFTEYQEHRLEDAQRTHDAVARIADHIPFGQPILVGHHSERRARKDVERIQTGMRKTVQMWQTAEYWQHRAAGALAHAKYKDRPGVRHRRIKGLESDLRRCKNAFTPSPTQQPQVWDGEEHVWITNGTRGGQWVKTSSLAKIEAHSRRWIAHLENRINYEKAMLGEMGGITADRFHIEVGGTVLVHGEWVVVLKLNRTSAGISSITTTPSQHWPQKRMVVEIERVTDYRAPEPGAAERIKAATKLPPLCNYPGDGFREMTQAQWDAKDKDYKTTRAIDATATHARHRVRYALTGGGHYNYLFITDAKRIDPPTLTPRPPEPPTVAHDTDVQLDIETNPGTELGREPQAAASNDAHVPGVAELEDRAPTRRPRP